MKSAQSERGNIIELVIIGVLVLGVIGLLVWRFVGSNQTASTTNTASTTSQTPQASQQSNTPSTESTTQTDPNKGYVVIDDWNVRFKPVGNTDIKYYKYVQNGLDMYEFTNKEAESLCGTAVSGGRHNATLVTLIRLKDKPDSKSFMADNLLNGGNAIGGYYYSIEAAQSSCAPSEKDTATLENDRDAVAAIVRTVEPKQ